MDIYKTLQDMLNEFIQLGWKPRGFSKDIHICDMGIWLDGFDDRTSYYYNDLFSKDSELMEFVDRNLIHEDYITIHEHGGFSYDIKSKADIVYMIMGNMTVDEKIHFFLDNVKVPTKL